MSRALPPLAAALLPLVGGQVCLHSAMAGLRMGAPLLALRDGHSAAAVGVLLALFAAAPIVLALVAGRMADRHGYHRPGWPGRGVTPVSVRRRCCRAPARTSA